MQTIKFFDWGYPDNPAKHQLGLWEPCMDRFLLIVSDSDIAETLRMIGSSRYSLFICNLNSADNYSSNLIDNTCCHHWTLSNKSQIRISDFNQFINPLDVQHLVSDNYTDSLDIDKEKVFLQTCLGWLKFIKHLKNFSGKWYYYYSFIKKIGEHDLPMDQDFYNQIDILENFILKNLYLSRDSELTSYKIECFMNTLNLSIQRCWDEFKYINKLQYS